MISFFQLSYLACSSNQLLWVYTRRKILGSADNRMLDHITCSLMSFLSCASMHEMIAYLQKVRYSISSVDVKVAMVSKKHTAAFLKSRVDMAYSPSYVLSLFLRSQSPPSSIRLKGCGNGWSHGRDQAWERLNGWGNGWDQRLIIKGWGNTWIMGGTSHGEAKEVGQWVWSWGTG